MGTACPTGQKCNTEREYKNMKKSVKMKTKLYQRQWARIVKVISKIMSPYQSLFSLYLNEHFTNQYNFR